MRGWTHGSILPLNLELCFMDYHYSFFRSYNFLSAIFMQQNLCIFMKDITALVHKLPQTIVTRYSISNKSPCGKLMLTTFK